MIINFKTCERVEDKIISLQDSEWTMRNVKVWNLCDMKKLLKCSGDRMLPMCRVKLRMRWGRAKRDDIKRKLSDDDELSLNLHLNDYDNVNSTVETLPHVHPPPSNPSTRRRVYLCYINFEKKNYCWLNKHFTI